VKLLVAIGVVCTLGCVLPANAESTWTVTATGPSDAGVLMPRFEQGADFVSISSPDYEGGRTVGAGVVAKIIK